LTKIKKINKDDPKAHLRFARGKKKVTRLQYEKLIEAFCQQNPNPGKKPNFSAAGKAAGVDRRTAQKAWERGWPNKNPPMTAISTVIVEQQRVARAKIARAEARQRQAALAMRAEAQEQAIKARAEEGAMVAITRRSATHLLRHTETLIRASQPLVETLRDQLMKRGSQFKMQKALILLERLNAFAKNTGDLVEQTMRLERLHLGEPETIIGHQVDMDVDEALQHLMEAGKALERWQDGLVDITPGKIFNDDK